MEIINITTYSTRDPFELVHELEVLNKQFNRSFGSSQKYDVDIKLDSRSFKYLKKCLIFIILQ